MSPRMGADVDDRGVRLEEAAVLLFEDRFVIDADTMATGQFSEEAMDGDDIHGGQGAFRWGRSKPGLLKKGRSLRGTVSGSRYINNNRNLAEI